VQNKKNNIQNMIRITLTWIFFLAILTIGEAQSYSTQILNKGAMDSNVSLLQDYDGDGDLDIIVSRENPRAVYWLENESTKQFPIHLLFSDNLTNTISDIDAADFDNDGDIDYLVSMTNPISETGELAWYQRQTDGTYVKWTVSAGKDFIMSATADFNNDGKMDIVSVGLGTSDETGRVYINEGNLFFTEKIVAQDVTEAVYAKDIDGDGDIDIVFGGSGLVGNPNQSDGGSRTMINDGNGNFSIGNWLITYTNSHAGVWEDIEIVDLNGDGLEDVLGFGSSGTTGLIFFNGANNFQRLVISEEGIDCGGDFVVFDIDNDGDLDIVRQERCDNVLIVLYQTNNMEFIKEYIDRNWDNSGNPTAKMSVGDLDGDGDLDLVFPEQGNTDFDISWFENINGKLYKHQIYGQLKGARIPKFADTDNDGDADILLTVSSDLGEEEDELMLFENLGNNNFLNWRLSDSLDYAADVEPADIDGDGDLDVFVTARDANDLVWLRNNGFKANWEKILIDANANQALGIHSTDLDADGDVDVVLCSPNDDKVFLYRNSGAGVFTKLVVDANVDAPREIEAADLDGDGDIDLALVCASTVNSVVFYINDGMQNFTKQVVFTGKTANDVEIADWNTDGKPDIIFTLSATSPINPQQEVIAMINNGGNSFTTTPLIINAEKGTGLKVADLDNDGDMDFVVGRNAQVRARMWLQTPAGLVGSTLSDAGTSGGTPQVLGLDVADTNGDGKNEVVFADFVRDELVLISFNCFSGAALTTSTVNAACGQPNGLITVTATGGTDLSYLWSNGATTPMAGNLAPGTYTVTVTANGGCTSTATATITAQLIATVSTIKTNATCGNANGTATVNSQNGVGLASFLWSSGATTQTATGLAAGTYTVTVTDVNGCTVTSSATISATPVATLTLTPTNTTCGNNDGKVTTTVTGGSPIASYLWSNGATIQNLLNVPGGSYSVTATDENGCQIVGTVTVTGLTNPTIDLGADITFQQGQQAILDAIGTGLTYLWSTGATTSTITVTSMGTYSVTVTNSSGCTATDAVVVTVTTSTNDQDNKFKITVSPNPAQDIIYIRCEGSSTTSVELIDNLGRLLIKDNSFAPDGAIRTVEVEKIPAGTYHLKVVGRGFSKMASIIKN
jgi:hypothetical protein